MKKVRERGEEQKIKDCSLLLYFEPWVEEECLLNEE
jgi:hypothetical protein